MSQRARDVLIVSVSMIVTLILGFIVVAIVAAVYEGRMIVPAITQNNFWSVINTFFWSVLIPSATLLGYRLTTIARSAALQSQENSEKLDKTIRTVAAINETVKNGGGAGVQAIAQQVQQLVEQGARNPDDRTRSSDTQGAP